MAVDGSMLALCVATMALAPLPPVRRVATAITPGWFDEQQQVGFNDARSLRAQARGGHGATDTGGGAATEDAIQRHKYWCADCSRGFDRRKQQVEHEAGKRHAAAQIASDASWEAWQHSAMFDADVPREAVAGAWSLELFLDGLPVRSRSRNGPRPATLSADSLDEGMISPSVTLSSLSAVKRARLWRYLRDLTSDPQLPERVAGVDPRYVRVKELLESCEIAALVERALRSRRGAPSTIYDVACGHGLVGLLLAHRLPATRVVSIDRKRRPAFDAWSAALDASANVQFRHGDFQELVDGSSTDSDSLVLCVHGCNEVNRDAVRAAQAGGASWLVVPCCLQTSLYVPSAASVRLPDQMRYSLLCGAMAADFNATGVWSIDRRITPRCIVLAGGGAGDGQ